jgi:hypothetical protein
LTAKFLALVPVLACFCTSALSKVNYFVPGSQCSSIGNASGLSPVPGDSTRVARLDIEKAIRRALTPPSRRAPAPPPQAAPPAQETREQWRQRLFDEMRSYCTKWPDDTACGPNALGGGAGR